MSLVTLGGKKIRTLQLSWPIAGMNDGEQKVALSPLGTVIIFWGLLFLGRGFFLGHCYVKALYHWTYIVT